MRASPDIADPIELLTPRERECLRLVDRHLSSKQIARELGMSKASVDTYCDRARRKLGVSDRYAAARALADRIAALVVDAADPDFAAAFDRAAVRLLSDAATRTRLTAASLELCDGRGAERAAEALLEVISAPRLAARDPGV